MIIGIDASRAFLPKRTGIEEYSYQVIKNLACRRAGLKDEFRSREACSPNWRVILYLRKNQKIDFEIPKNWKIKIIFFPIFWTQLGLSWEMFRCPVDVLFVPAHTVPFIHPKNTIVTVHGLEYEFLPKAYSFWEKMYMRFFIRKSCQWSNKIISVSKNTKKDLIDLYKVSAEKIVVIYEGFSIKYEISDIQNNVKHILFIGRIEERKNIYNIIEAFDILKEKYNIEQKLFLVGKSGYGYEKIKNKIENSKYKNDIVELGYISEKEKWNLLKNSDCFIFPTLYEGFGIPILEAQSVGCPVVTSKNSSIFEVVENSALLVDPQKPKEIAEAIRKVIFDSSFKEKLVEKGLKNTERFSWKKCAKEIAKNITEGYI